MVIWTFGNWTFGNWTFSNWTFSNWTFCGWADQRTGGEGQETRKEEGKRQSTWVRAGDVRNIKGPANGRQVEARARQLQSRGATRGHKEVSSIRADQ